MPLVKGSGRKSISQNIEELIGSYKSSGKIGNSKPENMEQARKQAAAIAYSKARESGRKKGK